jgi:hypothetical protein
VQLGRANLPNKPIFYAGSSDMTALGELTVEPGQFVQLIETRVREDAKVLPCGVVGDYQSIMESGVSHLTHLKIVEEAWALRAERGEDSHRRQMLVDSFLAEEFGKVNREQFEYRVTASYADKLLRAHGALIYPSTKVRGGLNLAASPESFDASFEVRFVAVYRIVNYYGYGVYEVDICRSAVSFARDGRINWGKIGRIELSFPATGPWRAGS